MGSKQLHELLGEDQEPFLLTSYIADRSFLISRKLPVKSPGNLCKGSCFFSFPDSPDPRRSPTCVNLRSPRNDNSVFLHVPAKTTALLLVAALRIQRNPASNKLTKLSSGLPGFRQFASLLKRLTHRDWAEKAKQRSDSSGCACSGSDGERHCSSSGFEAESSSDFEEEDDENVGVESKVMDDGEICVCSDEKSCESPFRFVLLRSPRSGQRTPEITSPPASSPIHGGLKDKDDADPESLKKLTVDDEEEEGGKEQCSPVCVLDPRFEDIDEEEEDVDAHEHLDGYKGSFNYESSFAIVQGAKQELLGKLYRFEKLAELDPLELEKRLLEQDSEEDDGTNDGLGCASFFVERELKSGSQEQDKLLAENFLSKEVRKTSCFEDRETVTRGVCKRLELWKEADFDRIDMMVERDLRSELDGWIRRDGEHVGEAPMEIEVAIFGLMLEELLEELVYFP